MLMLDATTNFPTGRRASTSISVAVPTLLTSAYAATSYMLCPTPTTAAR